MTQQGRWHEITTSPYAHEAEGLNRVRATFPNHAPFQAWTNFEFRDAQGRWHEVDLLVLGRRRLHLVELKYYNGTLRGDDHRWLRDGHRAEDSPLKLARRKAQKLRSKLEDELTRWAREHKVQVPRAVVPYVQESVFLHHPDLRCELPQTTDLFGIDGNETRSGLPGISDRLVESATPMEGLGVNRDLVLAQLMVNIGVVQRRERDVGSWVIAGEPGAEGEDWQDWPATHRALQSRRARIRFRVTPPGTSAGQVARVRRVVEHEFRIMSRLRHDGLLAPEDLVDDELGVGLVYPADARLQRLDLWLADQPGGIALATSLSVIRQIAEAVGYAHGSKVVHRGLSPYAVQVRSTNDVGVKAVVGDWQSAGTFGTTSLTGMTGEGVTALHGTEAGQRLQGLLRPPDADRRFVEAFEAPEGIWNPDADRVRLDVFAIGALAYYLLAGRPAASDRRGLRERLQRDHGLDLAADMPQVPSALRELVLAATHSSVTERLGDVGLFLKGLAVAERALENGVADALDPLEATPGQVIDGRFRLERRLGAGSTAVGLLVTDLAVGTEGPDAVRVLKVALDDTAAVRVTTEADVLRVLKDPRLVRMVEGPIEVGGRTALLLDSAGEQTLGDVLKERRRLSLDLIERYGTDVLEALVALDRAGVDHRDIKPANLGVREGRGDRVKHLVLFDFSLTRAGATALSAGTPPYLDPFLDTPSRGRFDSAAERYAAAVVLFEMATGGTPVYGDGLSDPGVVADEATLTEDQFDPSVAKAVLAFFRCALARDAGQRHDTAVEMLSDWRAIFAPVTKTVPDDAEALAAAATPTTPLLQAGLTARALSALEPFGVVTVGDLVAVDPVRLNRIPGAADATRREVKDRARVWRDRLAAVVLGRGDKASAEDVASRGDGLDAQAAALLLVSHAGAAKAEARRSTARLLLGLDPGLDAFANRREISAVLGVTRARADQHVAALQNAWADDQACRDVLDLIGRTAQSTVVDSGGVATIDELTDAVLAAFPPGRFSRADDQPDDQRIVSGLLRLALDRAHALDLAEADDQPLSSRRRGGRVALLASDPALLDAAEALGRQADALITEAAAAGEPVVGTRRAADRLRATLRRLTGVDDPPAALAEDTRVLRLAAALAIDARLSGADELHHRSLPPATALALALSGVGGTQPVKAQEIRDRVRARFPALPAMPDRPRLDTLVEEAGLGLVYDDVAGAYRSKTRVADTTGLAPRPGTVIVPVTPTLVEGGHLGHRLNESVASRSFLALGVTADRTDRAVRVLVDRYRARLLDVTAVLLAALQTEAASAGLSWEQVQAADAAEIGSRPAEGLAVLVARALPVVHAAIEAAGDAGGGPVLLTDAAPLARYGHLASIARWTDLAAARGSAVWLLVPQLLGNQGATVDGRPLPLAAPGQFLRLDTSWVDTQHATPVTL